MCREQSKLPESLRRPVPELTSTKMSRAALVGTSDQEVIDEAWAESQESLTAFPNGCGRTFMPDRIPPWAVSKTEPFAACAH